VFRAASCQLRLIPTCVCASYAQMCKAGNAACHASDSFEEVDLAPGSEWPYLRNAIRKKGSLV
jgi:hypothetical protein